MSFFGLTYFGPPSYFRPHLASVQNLNDFPDSEFQVAFDSLADSQGSIDLSDLSILLSKVFRCEPNASDLRALRNLLEAGDREELRATPALPSTAHLNSSSVSTLTMSAITAISERGDEKKSQTLSSSRSIPESKRISWSEFYSALRIARASRAAAGSAGSCEFSSSNEFTEKMKTHKRMQLAPQEKYRTPITTAQEYGWHQQINVEKTERKPNISCPETRYASELIKSGIYF